MPPALLAHKWTQKSIYNRSASSACSQKFNIQPEGNQTPFLTGKGRKVFIMFVPARADPSPIMTEGLPDWVSEPVKAHGCRSICGFFFPFPLKRASPLWAESKQSSAPVKNVSPRSQHTCPRSPHRSMSHIISTTHTHLNTPLRPLSLLSLTHGLSHTHFFDELWDEPSASEATAPNKINI